MASKIAQYSPKWLKIAPNMPTRGYKTTPRRLQVATEPPKDTPERPKSFTNLGTGRYSLHASSKGAVPQRDRRRLR